MVCADGVAVYVTALVDLVSHVSLGLARVAFMAQRMQIHYVVIAWVAISMIHVCRYHSQPTRCAMPA